jgi:ABC-type phosphate transport system substrate-binding protein
MRTRKNGDGILYVVLKTAFLLLILSSVSLAQVAVIVNKSVPIKSADASTIFDIYSLNAKEWSDGTPIIVVVMKSSEDTAQKFYQYIGKRPLEMKKLWMRAQLSGEGKAPVAFGSDEDVVAKVASTPGAIGFVRKLRADSSVKTILIIE